MSEYTRKRIKEGRREEPEAVRKKREAEEAERRAAHLQKEAKKLKDKYEMRKKRWEIQREIARLISPIEVTIYEAEGKARKMDFSRILESDLHKARGLIKGIKEELEKGNY